MGTSLNCAQVTKVPNAVERSTFWSKSPNFCGIWVFRSIVHVIQFSLSTLNCGLAIACGKILLVSAYTSHVQLKFPV